MTFTRGLLAILFIATTFLSFSQSIDLPEDKVKWSFSVEQDGCEATIIAKIRVVEHWHITAVKLP